MKIDTLKHWQLYDALLRHAGTETAVLLNKNKQNQAQITLFQTVTEV